MPPRSRTMVGIAGVTTVPSKAATTRPVRTAAVATLRRPRPMVFAAFAIMGLKVALAQHATSAWIGISTMRPLHRIGRGVDVDQLRAFVAVARAGRFTRAARRLGTTQPSLSRRVQQLEAQVGAKLVVRTPAGVVLTSAGERFLVHAERALASVDAGRTAIEELSGDPRGVVTLGSQPTISAYILPALLARFQRRAPQVVLRLREGVADQIEERLASGELDLALMNLPVRRVDLAAQKLWQEDYLLAVAPSH